MSAVIGSVTVQTAIGMTTLLALHFLDTAASWAERALTDAMAHPERARRHLGIARVALTVARQVRLSGEGEVRP